MLGEPMNAATNLLAGLTVELERRADLRHPAPVEHDDLVGQRHRFDLVVGDINHRRAESGVQLGEFEPHLHAQLGVEIGQRLVEQEGLAACAQARGRSRRAGAVRPKTPPVGGRERLELENARDLGDALVLHLRFGMPATESEKAIFCRTVMCGYSA